MEVLDIKKATKDCGGKAFGLALLNKIGLPIPSGFIIKNSETINDGNIFLIKDFLEKLDNKVKLAVRSSATLEDGKEKSFAGIFDTKLNVNNNIDSIVKAIKIINNGIEGPKVKSYSDIYNQTMNVIVQEMVDAKLAGVLFTTAIDINGDDVVLIEIVEGFGEKLVSGTSDSTRVIMKVKDNKIIEDNVRVEGNLLDLKDIKRLIPYINIIKEQKVDYDIEWCIDKNKNPFFVQARPITSTVFVNKKISNQGIVASRGYTRGKTYVIKDSLSFDEVQKQLDNFEEGSILVTGITTTFYMSAIKKSKGIITEEGSSLSHAAIVARELGIPCIVGYKNATKIFPTGTEIILDATNSMIVCNGIKLDYSNNDINFYDLACYDDAIRLDILEKPIFLEASYHGLAAHTVGEYNNPHDMEIIEKFIRKKFKTSANYYYDDKYYIYLEIERYKKFPFYKKMIDIAKEISQKKDIELLNDFYDKMIEILKDLVKYRFEGSVEEAEVFTYEISSVINLILGAILPKGYAIKQCYYDSINLLDKYNLSFSDLLYKEDLAIKNKELKKIKSFLSMTATKRNEIYSIIEDTGAMFAKYYGIRNSMIKASLKNEEITDVDKLYENINKIDLSELYEIVEEKLQQINL